MCARRVIASTVLGLVLSACVFGCKSSSPDEPLRTLWQRWQPVQPPEKLEDHDWLVGAWQLKQHELLPNSVVGPPNPTNYVYMEVSQGYGHTEFNKASSLTLDARFLMPDSRGRFGKRSAYWKLGYYGGFYAIGHPAQFDPFYMRRNPRNLTNEFILKHEMDEDYLRFERITPEAWEELWELWELQEQAAWTYLGLPEDKEYPDYKFDLDTSVPWDKYWRVSKIRHVSKDEFVNDVTSGRAMFRNERSGLHYYATELRGDFFRRGDTRYRVTILERKVYP